jgi:hypothetical protein
MPSSGQRRKRPGPLAAPGSYTGEAHRPADQRRPAQRDRRRPKHSVAPATPVTPGHRCEPDYRPHPTPDRRFRTRSSRAVGAEEDVPIIFSVSDGRRSAPHGCVDGHEGEAGVPCLPDAPRHPPAAVVAATLIGKIHGIFLRSAWTPGDVPSCRSREDSARASSQCCSSLPHAGEPSPFLDERCGRADSEVILTVRRGHSRTGCMWAWRPVRPECRWRLAASSERVVKRRHRSIDQKG